MKELKTNKGITLIALIITIIVLLILAVVSIRLVMNNGILGKAESAVDQYGTAEEQEQIKLAYAEYQMAQASGKSENLTVAGANVEGEGPWKITFSSGNVYSLPADGSIIIPPPDQVTILEAQSDNMLAKTNNSITNDEYGNKIVVPAGFKIKVDDDTNNATHVTEGIVVTDGTNEFVWIPVGKIYTDVAKTEAKAKTITLGRYSDFTVGATPVQTLANYSEQVKIDSYYTEDTSANHNGSYKNVIANDIKAFLESSNNNGGYYLGRYEAREKDNTTTERTDSSSQTSDVVCNKDNIVYNYITQPNASARCQGMYTNKPFTSDLINSYAWDTAIMFIENFSDNSSYSSKDSVNTSYANKGTSSDKISNIYDMASNCLEWSTETCSYSSNPCLSRGGFCILSVLYTSYRSFGSTTDSGESYSFRPLLYM